MTDQPAAETPESPMPDKADEPPVAGNVTVEGHGTYTGRDDNSINVTDSPGAIVAREITVVQQIAPGKTRRLTDVEDYLTAMHEYCANLPYLTLHDIRPPKTLDEVYVPLKTRPLPRKDEGKSEDEQERLEREAFRLEPMSIAEVMRQREAPHVLILGEPGAGKSTLLRQMADRAWDVPSAIGLSERHLPLLVPLRLLASASGSLDERLSEVLKNEMALPRALPDGYFDEWPQQTGALWLILLDALDEVPDSERARLMQWLKGQLPHLREHRVVITSRPAGYKADFEPKIFGHYDLQPFTPEQAGEFAYKWFNDEAEAFLKELGRIRVGESRGTPLLLTIAAKVYSEVRHLPLRRSGLYTQFVNIWLQEAKQLDSRPELRQQLWNAAEFALAQLALAMIRATKPVQELQLIQLLANYFVTELHLSVVEAKSDARDFIQVMARRSGVLTRYAQTYQFVHPTFQEYLAARTIVYSSELKDTYNVDEIWQTAVSHWRTENWRNVVLFVLDILSDANIDVTQLLERIRENDDIETIYFVSMALGQKAQVATNFANSIVNLLLTRARYASLSELLNVPNALVVLGEMHDYPLARDGLIALANDEGVAAGVRAGAAEALGQLEPTDKAKSTLLALVYDEHVATWVRERSAKALGRLGWVDGLLVVGRDAQLSDWVRIEAAEALGQLGHTREAALIWLSLVEDRRSEDWVLVKIAEALGKLGRTEIAISIWLELAHNEDATLEVRARTAEALGQLG